MKKIVAVIATLLSFNAAANPDVIGALILGGFVGNLIGTENERQKHPQVIIQPQVVPYPGGYYSSPQYMIPRRPVYRPITMWDPNCRCYVQYWQVVE